MANVAIVGATGIVGFELLQLLEKPSFSISRLSLFGSDKSLGRSLNFRSEKKCIQKLSETDFKAENLVFFCTPSAVSQKYVPFALKAGAFVIDMSTAFRESSNSCLCIPEITSNAMQKHQLFSSPNCVASIMSLVLFPLHKLFKLKTVIASTYQSVSGGGYNLLKSLLDDTKSELQGTKHKSSAFNVYLHNSKTFDDGYNYEEKKIISELQKILDHPNLSVSVTAVRVPTLRCHSVSCHLTFEKAVDLVKARNALKLMPGIKIIDKEPFAMRHDAEKSPLVFCSRIRKVFFSNYILELWIVGDQLLKGAALNAYQIAEHLTRSQMRALKQSSSALLSQDA